MVRQYLTLNRISPKAMFNTPCPCDVILCVRCLSSWVHTIANAFISKLSPKSVNFSPIRTMRIILSEIWMEIQIFYFKTKCFKTSSAIRRHNELTLNVRGPSYLGLTRSISWLLMPWLLTSPGHQQPWYWQCRICKSWSYLRKDFKHLRHTNVE